MAYNQTNGASYSNGDVGQLIMGVRKPTDDIFSASGTNLYQPVLFDTAGNLRVNVIQQAGGGSSVTVTSASNVLAVNIVTDSVGIGGGIQFGDGTTSTNVTGTAIMGVSSANVTRYVAIDGNRYLYTNLGSSSGLLTVSSVNSSFVVSSASNIITVSATNPSFVISSGSNILSVSNVNNAIQISSAGNIITVSATNSSFVVSSASNYLATRYDGSNYSSTATYTALSTALETIVWTPAAGKKFVITDLVISASAAGTCTLRDGATGSTFMLLNFAANGGMAKGFRSPYISASATNKLTAQASVATQNITIFGYEM